MPLTRPYVPLVLTLVAGACAADAPTAARFPARAGTTAVGSPYRYSYIVAARDGAVLPATLDADARAAGAELVATVPQIGLAVIQTDDPDFAERTTLAGIEAIVPDLPMTGADAVGDEAGTLPEADAFAGAPPIPAGGDALSGLQWALQAIHAPEAWALGYSGRGVRVAVLDAGIQSTHPDLAPNINAALSTSFVPGETYNSPPGSHGTQVAGIIAATRNGIGTVGVAPNAELVIVKTLPANSSGRLSTFAQGLVYAADVGARIANISAGTNAPRATEVFVDDRGTPDPDDDVRIRVSNAAILTTLRLLSRATNYAHAKGTLIIAASGNIKKDFDHAKSDIGFPQELPHVVTVGPTGPVGWALDFTTDLDVSPSYTNRGLSYIQLAAPGGNFDVFDRPGLPSSCTLLVFTRPCQVFDLVMTTGLGSSYVWNFGGSFAAPHAAGVAALVLEKLGPSTTPDQLEMILRNTADDIGKPGNDEFFGQGRVNALRAVQYR